MKKLIYASLIFAAGCSGSKSGDGGTSVQSREQQAVACLASVDVAGAAVYAEDIADGQAGTYKLVDTRTFSVLRKDGKLSYIAGRTTFSKYADPNRAYIDGRSSVACADVKDVPAGQVSTDARQPIAFQRVDGKMPSTLKFNVNTSYVQNGDDTKVAQKSSANFSTSQAYGDDSVFKRDGYTDAKRSFIRVDANTVAIRVEATTDTSTIVMISIYQLI